MPTLKGTEASLSYVHCFLYLVSSSVHVPIFRSMWMDTFWTDLVSLTLKGHVLWRVWGLMMRANQGMYFFLVTAQKRQGGPRRRLLT